MTMDISPEITVEPASVATSAMRRAAYVVEELAFDQADPFGLTFVPPHRNFFPRRGDSRPAMSWGPELAEALNNIDARNSELAAFTEVDRDPAGIGPLVSVKDLIHVEGFATRGGSDAYFAAASETRDGTAIGRIRSAGMRIIGKTETHEFGLGVTTPQSRNPFDSTRLAGGSSGGAAISVAAHMSWAAVATDTRASIRVPSALCGVVGFKPTYGHVPVDGLIQLSWSVDTIGAIARDVAAATRLVDVMASSDLLSAWQADIRGMRVGVPPAALVGCEPAVLAAFERGTEALQSLGVEVVEVDRPSAVDLENANHAGLLATRSEAAAWHRAARTALERSTQETADQLSGAHRVSAIEYLNAQWYRMQLARAFLVTAAASRLDAWAMPTVPVVAPKVEEASNYLMILSRNAIPWSITGFAVLSVPLPVEGLPVGLQLVVPPNEDATLVAIGSALEAAWQ
jgi:aspartyl-tRNA(Asn)/glutamyl-tRNA(Gln) amidotransferase subunit A